MSSIKRDDIMHCEMYRGKVKRLRAIKPATVDDKMGHTNSGPFLLEGIGPPDICTSEQHDEEPKQLWWFRDLDNGELVYMCPDGLKHEIDNEVL